MKILKSFALYAVITLCTLFFLEWGFRWSGHKPAGLPNFTMALTKADPVLGFRSQANANWWVDMTPQGSYVARYFGSTDSQGYRPLKFNANCQDCKTILALGDSMTFGVESPDNATWPEQLAVQLTSHEKAYKVRNLSYRGWGTLQEAMALEEYAKAGGKADVVLLMVVLNDPLDNISQRYFRSAPMVVVNEVGATSLQAPQDNGELANTDRLWRRERWIRQSAAATYFYNKVGGAPLVTQNSPPQDFDLLKSSYSSVMWAPNVYPFVMNELHSLSSPASDVEAAHKQVAFAYSLKRVKEACDKMGAKLIITGSPSYALENGKNAASLKALLGQSQDQFNQFAKSWSQFNANVGIYAAQIGASYIDINRALDDLDFHQYAALPTDWHSSAEANSFIARNLAQQIIQKQMIP